MSYVDGTSEKPRNSEMHRAGLALHRVNEMLEEQSKRIAHAVHDEAGQLLAAVMIRLEESERELHPSCGSCFQEIRQMLEQIEFQLRELSHDLRPSILDDFGLLPAVQLLAERVSKRSGLTVSMEHSIAGRLSPSTETALYRVVQEALTNAAKHSRAKHVQISIFYNGYLHCSIRDDGAGFDMNEVSRRSGTRGLGLLGMRERVELVGGSLSISSQVGRGTELTIRIPREA